MRRRSAVDRDPTSRPSILVTILAEKQVWKWPEVKLIGKIREIQPHPGACKNKCDCHAHRIVRALYDDGVTLAQIERFYNAFHRDGKRATYRTSGSKEDTDSGSNKLAKVSLEFTGETRLEGDNPLHTKHLLIVGSRKRWVTNRELELMLLYAFSRILGKNDGYVAHHDTIFEGIVFTYSHPHKLYGPVKRIVPRSMFQSGTISGRPASRITVSASHIKVQGLLKVFHPTACFTHLKSLFELLAWYRSRN